MTVSVVIPTTDWDEMLWRLELNLSGLAQQITKPHQVVVVDSIGLTDKVEDLVNQFQNKLNIQAARLPYKDIVFRTGAARNKGVDLLEPCDRVLFLDADCVPYPRTIEAHANNHAPDRVLLGYRVHVKPKWAMRGNVFKVYEATPHQLDHRLRSGKTDCTWKQCHSHHVSFCYALFNKVGGFWPKTVIAEDVEIALRCERAGGTFQYVSQPRVKHIDHPVWRPLQKKNNLPPWHVSWDESLKLAGYLRTTPSFLDWRN